MIQRLAWFMGWMAIVAAVGTPGTWGAETVSFPESPDRLAECYRAGQAWLQEHLWSGAGLNQTEASQFNIALGRCTLRSREGRTFQWAKEYEFYDRSLAILGRFPNGDWVLFGSSNGSEPRLNETVFAISKKFALLHSYKIWMPHEAALWGFDFGHYDFPPIGRALGVRSFQANARFQSAEFTLRLLLGNSQALGEHEVLAVPAQKLERDRTRNEWVMRECSFSIAPDPLNSLPKLTEDCRSRSGAELAALKSQKMASGAPRTSRDYRWDGSRLTDEDPTAWLAKLDQQRKLPPPLKLRRLKTQSKPSQLASIRFREYEVTDRPEVGEAVNKINYFELLSGAPPSALKKINRQVYDLVKPAFDAPLDVEPDESGQFLFNRGSSYVGVQGVHSHWMTVTFRSLSEPAGTRAYESGDILVFDLRTGERVEPLSSFLSPKERAAFTYWLMNRFQDEFNYQFPDQFVRPASSYPPTAEYRLLPEAKGLQVLTQSTAVGYYFTQKLGVIPYEAIPREWIRTGSALAEMIPVGTKSPAAPRERPLFKPRTHCLADSTYRSDDHSLPTRICRLKLTAEFDAVILKFQTGLEAEMGLEEGISRWAEKFAALEGELVKCSPQDRSCHLQLLSKEVSVTPP